MREKIKIHRGVTLALSFLIISAFSVLSASASRLGGGDYESYQSYQKTIQEAEKAADQAKKEAEKSEQALLDTILKKVNVKESLTSVEQEKYDTWKTLEAEKKKKKEADQEKKRQQEILRGYDAAKEKKDFHETLSVKDKAKLDKWLKDRETYAKNKAIEESGTRKIEAEGYKINEIDSLRLKEAIEKVEGLNKEEVERLEQILERLIQEEQAVKKEQEEVRQAVEDGQALYEEAVKLINEAEKDSFGTRVENQIQCNSQTDNMKRVICKFKQSEEDFKAEVSKGFAPEECFYYGSPIKPGETYNRCVAKHTKINACWTLMADQRSACVKKALDLPEKLVSVGEFCKGKTEDCREKYQNAAYDYAGFKYLTVADQVETWYFEGAMEIDVAAFRVEQIMRTSKAYHWAKDKAEKQKELKNLALIWEDIKKSLVEQVVDELKEKDEQILKEVQKKLAEGKKVEELSLTEKEAYQSDYLKRQNMASEKYNQNILAKKEAFEGMTQEEKNLVNEVFLTK